MLGLGLTLLVLGAAVSLASTATVVVQLVRRPAVIPTVIAAVLVVALVTGSVLLVRGVDG